MQVNMSEETLSTLASFLRVAAERFEQGRVAFSEEAIAARARGHADGGLTLVAGQFQLQARQARTMADAFEMGAYAASDGAQLPITVEVPR